MVAGHDGRQPLRGSDAAARPGAYEWWLSDHPWAVAERTRRHAATLQWEFDNAAQQVNALRAPDRTTDYSGNETDQASTPDKRTDSDACADRRCALSAARYAHVIVI